MLFILIDVQFMIAYGSSDIKGKPEKRIEEEISVEDSAYGGSSKWGRIMYAQRGKRETKRRKRKVLSISSPPEIKFIPKNTARERINIKGITCPRCTIVVEVNDRKFSTVSDRNGDFSIMVELDRGKENIIRIYAKKGRRTSPFLEYRVVHRELPEVKSLDFPPEIDKGSIPRYTNEPAISIFGRTVPNVKVIAEGGSNPAYAFSDDKGFFEILVFLKFDSLNTIRVRAEGEGGFVSPYSEVSIYQITKAPPAPSLEDVPKITNRKKLEIEGKTVPGLTVIAKLPAGGDIKTVADEEGKFKIDIPLLENTENSIEIFAVDPAGNLSAPSRIKVMHDSNPPLPPNIKAYPQETYQDKVKIVGEGEPNTKIIARVINQEFEVGEVDSVGKFIVDIPVFKYKRQVRRNLINVFLEDKAGNRSAPSLIVVDVYPDIKRFVLDIYLGFHTFLGAFGNEFFENPSVGKDPTNFWGINFEVQGDWLLQNGSGISLGAILGMTYAPPREINSAIIQQSGARVEGDPKEVSQITLGTFFLIPTARAVILVENFDISAGFGIGPLFFLKRGPTLSKEENLIRLESLLFPGYALRVGGKIRYVISDTLSAGIGVDFSHAPVQNVNEQGDSADAGGIYIKGGISLHF